MMKNNMKTIFAALTVVSTAFGLSCISAGTIDLRGAGASFPKPIYEKWASEFGKLNKNVRIDYQSVGSGAGQRAILAKTVDFGASDDPMKDEDLKKAEAELLHIPTVLGAVVLTYNLKGVDKPIKLTSEVISNIYLGKIKRWNHPKLKVDNPDIKFPDTYITPVYRADSSGTTAVFTDFLSKTNDTFREIITASKQPNWVKRVGIGAKGNDGVMGQVKQTPNTIGYVEVAFAKENKLPIALIKNKAGNFVAPTIDNISAAASGSIKDISKDLRIKIANADGENSYPISSFTYILAYKEQKNGTKGKALADFLWWAVHDGSQYAEALHYAPLPKKMVEKVEKKIKSLSANGKPLLESGRFVSK